MLNVVMLNGIMLSVVAPIFGLAKILDGRGGGGREKEN
jgi:hypothetical protein